MNNKLNRLLVPFLTTGSLVGANAQEATPENTGVDVGNLVVTEYGEISNRLNELAETPEGRETAASMLEWIDKVEMFHLPWVNWVLVAAGVALFGSHLGQLLLGKLWVGIRGGGWSITETLNDALVAGFALLALPVVMTIPIGADSFVDRPLAVISSVAVGAVMALILYFHGVRQERLAAKGKSEHKAKAVTASA
ncbi:hypothetical protein AAFN60_20605 [Roseibacillus persicicus]|uniref:hypothetical protein n=1 Tax=Roseibacillus persicicus TaxID=454148 RepID=UPI00398AE6D6